ncbi:MAG: hypothetical protein CMJ20_08485 [Phycisphaeraceae bacterium]|nr:hypothetical protein [Phycisphaeraceae bacterium]
MIDDIPARIFGLGGTHKKDHIAFLVGLEQQMRYPQSMVSLYEMYEMYYWSWPLMLDFEYQIPWPNGNGVW